MKQCPECLKWFNNEKQRCPECCVQLSENKTSSEDNRDFIEQMNAQSEQIKLLDTALDIAAEDIDFDVLGTCPNEFDNYGCPFGECKFADGKPHENDCWKQAFIKAAEKHLRGEK